MTRTAGRRSGGRRVDVPGTFHHVWLWEGEGLVLTDTHAPDAVHRHVAVQVVVSLDQGAELAQAAAPAARS